MSRKPYPSDISEEEWHFVAPYLTLMDVHAPQRRHDLREVFNALRWLARAGAPWRLLPHDLSPWQMVYQQFRRWDEAGCFEAMVNDMRLVIRVSGAVIGTQPSKSLKPTMAACCGIANPLNSAASDAPLDKPS